MKHPIQLARIFAVEFGAYHRLKSAASLVLLVGLLACGTQPASGPGATDTPNGSPALATPRRVWADGTMQLGDGSSPRNWAARTEAGAGNVSGTAGVRDRGGSYLLYDLTATIHDTEIIGDLIASPDHPAHQRERYSLRGSIRGVRLSGTISASDASGEWEGWWTSAPVERTVTTLTASIVTANPGQLIWFDVAFNPGGRSIAGIQNDLTISGTAIRIQECVVNPEVRKDLSWIQFPDENGIRAIVFSLTNTGPILSPMPLYRCEVAIASDSEPGTYSIRLTGASASDPLGNVKDVAVEDGTITVSLPNK